MEASFEALGASWEHLGGLLAASWDSWRALGVSWRPLRGFLCGLGAVLGDLGAVLGCPWSLLGDLGAAGVDFESI